MRVLVASVVLNLLLWVVAGRNHMYILPFLGAVCVVMNGTLGYAVRGVSWRAAWVLWWNALGMQLILVIVFLILWRLIR